MEDNVPLKDHLVMIFVDLRGGALNSKIILNVEAPIAQWNLKRTLPPSSKYLLATWPEKLCYGAHRCHSSQLQACTVTSALQIRDLSTRHQFSKIYSICSQSFPNFSWIFFCEKNYPKIIIVCMPTLLDFLNSLRIFYKLKWISKNQ